MELQCQLSHPEMREAFRMNLTPSFWFKAALSNLRAVVLLVVVVGAVVAKIAGGETKDWGAIAGILGFALFLVAIYAWRLSRTLKKTAETTNSNCNRMTLDPQGVTAASATGASSFTPWTQYKRWKEGKLVFTIGEAKAFQTVPKSALTESQANELRGLLQSQIRQP